MEYERYALVVDDRDSVLGKAAMQLLEVGIDVLYVNDLDEAQLLAQQESTRIGAVLVPNRFGEAEIEGLLRNVCSRIDAGRRGLVLTGERPAPGACDRLRKLGLEWGAFQPVSLREMRFVLSAAMAQEHVDERRKSTRIPMELPTVVFMGRHRKEVTLHDLSETGAYFATPHPFLEDSVLSIELPLANEPIFAKGVVVNAKTADKAVRRDVPDGMGVVFSDLSPGGRERLAGHVVDWIARFRI